jgi:voltage-gated potassium channel
MRPRDAALLVVVLWLLAVIVFGTVEHLVDRETFPTVWLGMWWALQTVTTVGYGDIVPRQSGGRAIATLLLLGGLAFISVVTAMITSGFVALREHRLREAGEDPVIQRLDAIAARLDRLEGEVGSLRRSSPPRG